MPDCNLWQDSVGVQAAVSRTQAGNLTLMFSCCAAVCLPQQKQGWLAARPDLPCAAQAQANGGSGAQEFKLGEALAYMANMRTFWMITVGLGGPSLLPRLPCMLAPCRTTSLLHRCAGHPWPRAPEEHCLGVQGNVLSELS